MNANIRLPIGWVVLDGRHGAALFVERPAADAFAVKVHGQVQPLYTGAQLSQLLAEAAAARQAAVTPTPETPPSC